LKMKLVSLAFFLVDAVVSLRVPVAGVFLPVFFGAAFGAYGIIVSMANHLDPLNDVPNALRVFLASLGGYLVTVTTAFLFPSLGVMLLFSALYLNDEFQRKAFRALRTGTRGGSVALLGIDGSGKSSHSLFIGRWLEARGYSCTVLPFHRYLFVERLAAVTSAVGGAGSGGRERFGFRRGGNPLRPVASLLDNLVLQLLSSAGCRVEGRVVIYDRFIWSTYVKYKALGYPVRAISGLYLSPRPTFALVLDVPPEKSLQVIEERVTHIRYPREVLQAEREEYLEIARRRGYPVIDASAPFREVEEEIESRLDALFPPVSRGARAG
jgi:thymidylate kinase